MSHLAIVAHAAPILAITTTDNTPPPISRATTLAAVTRTTAAISRERRNTKRSCATRVALSGLPATTTAVLIPSGTSIDCNVCRAAASMVFPNRRGTQAMATAAAASTANPKPP